MAESQVVSRLSELKQRAERLNSATDATNALIASVEKQVVDTNIGIEVWLPIALAASDETGSPRGETSQVVERLGYAKVSGAWCFATKKIQVTSGFFEGDTSCPYTSEHLIAEPEALRKASRDVRLRALELIPTLLERLTERADESLRVIELAHKTLE